MEDHVGLSLVWIVEDVLKDVPPVEDHVGLSGLQMVEDVLKDMFPLWRIMWGYLGYR